jgi:hypothetical protein
VMASLDARARVLLLEDEVSEHLNHS